jgi:hypothetical protein
MRWLLKNRPSYAVLQDSQWPRSKASDDWSDSYESMILLWKRYRGVGDAFDWLDWATLQHIHRKRVHPTYGPYTGGHFDGGVGRCLCMHRMLCSQGVRAEPFAKGVQVGAIQQDGSLYLTALCDESWNGKLIFDGPRTRFPAATLDWARLNEMPQWFVADPDQSYTVRVNDEAAKTETGASLSAGLPVRLNPNTLVKILITPKGAERE